MAGSEPKSGVALPEKCRQKGSSFRQSAFHWLLPELRVDVRLVLGPSCGERELLRGLLLLLLLLGLLLHAFHERSRFGGKFAAFADHRPVLVE
jgi:hypothetical protein